MTVIRVPREDAESLRLKLAKRGLLSKEHSIVTQDASVLIPLSREPEGDEEDIWEGYGAQLLDEEPKESLRWNPIPFHRICEGSEMPPDLKEQLPRRWEMLGDLLVLRLPDPLLGRRQDIARVYASVLGARTVLLDKGIKGRYREPMMEVLLGDDTETVCLENGIRYRLDAARLMFSSGNIDERIRMGKTVKQGEVVLDMFAGIGYFSIPAAVHGKASRVVACEINPVAHSYLCQNIVLNRVEGIVDARLGDCREVAPMGEADRVIMGYLVDTHEFLEAALAGLKDGGGVIHYHEQCLEDGLPDGPVSRVKDAASRAGMKVEDFQVRWIKSVAPRLYHVVVDAQIER